MYYRLNSIPLDVYGLIVERYCFDSWFCITNFGKDFSREISITHFNPMLYLLKHQKIRSFCFFFWGGGWGRGGGIEVDHWFKMGKWVRV